MYGIITCSGCKRDRMISLSAASTICPYCGKKIDTKTAVVSFSDKDQNIVREVFDRSSGFVIEKKEKKEDKDPLSTLAYKIDHCPDIEVKMKIIANGLTEILGTFTIRDVEELIPKDGKKYVEAMLENCMIYETEYGHYKT